MSDFLTFEQLQELEQDATAFQKFMTDSFSTPNPPYGNGTVTLRNGDVIPNLQRRLSQIGLLAVVDFESGLNVNSTAFTVSFQGDVYVARSDAVPFTTTGTFNTSQWSLLAAGRSVETPSDFETFTAVPVGGYVIVLSTETRYIRVPDFTANPDVDHTGTGGHKYNQVSGNLAGVTNTAAARTNIGMTEAASAAVSNTGLPVIGDASVTDNSIEIGMYGYVDSLGSSGGPAGIDFGLLIHMRRNLSTGEVQHFIEQDSGEIYVRSRSTIGGSWRPWIGGRATEAIATAGTDNLTVMTPLRTAQAIEVRQATSGPHTIVAGGQVVIAHGLSSAPRFINYKLKCLVAEAGYSIGDELFVDFNNSGNDVSRYNAAIVDATNITIRFSIVAASFVAGHKTTGSIAGLTNANWELYVEAMI